MCVAATAVGAVAPTAMFANGKNGSSNRWGDAGSHRHKPKSQYEDITAVNEGTKTVTIGHKNGKDHSEHAVTVNFFTEITVDGQKVDVTNGTDNVASALDATHTQ